MNRVRLQGVLTSIALCVALLMGFVQTADATHLQDDSSAQDTASQSPTSQSPTHEELLARHPIQKLLVQDPRAPDATATLEQLTAGVTGYMERLTSLPEFLIESQVVDVERGVGSLYGHHVPGFRRIIAHQGNAWLAMNTELHDTTFIPYYSVWKDGITLSQERRHFSLVWGPGARFAIAQPYTLLMGIDMLREMPGGDKVEKEKLRHNLLEPAFINRSTDYVVLPKQQMVDGAWCHVVQFAGLQTLWIDTNLNFAVRQRVYNWHENGSCERVVYQRDYKEIVPELPFPQTIIEELYAQPLEVERPYWNQVTSTSTHKILRLETKDIDPGTFEIPVPEGSEVYDYVRQKQFVVSYGEEEPFKEAIEFSRRMGERSWTTIGFGLGALGGLLLAAMFCRRAYLLWRPPRIE